MVTNDAWFVGSSELRSHFAAAVFRAVENGRFVIQAANGGASGLIDPRGRILAETTDETVTAGTVHVRSGSTPYTRWGDLPLIVLCGIGLLIVLLPRLVKRGGE